jgi:MYXO-CTERM domain-containing protein
VTCEASCYGSCQAECEVDPGAFECQASCEADCSGSCAARCSSEDSECWAACEATCSAECGASCEVTPPQADCVAQCDACCGGSCRAEANLDCQLDCQAEGWAECKVDLQGGCEADCRDAGAALFCDGQYVDHGNNLQECIDSLQAMLNAEVHGEAELTCRPGECTFDSSGMLACSVGGGARPAGAAWALGLIGLGLIGRRRRHVTAISGSRT